eukprot:1192595-Prorocentrum_minimum.AAC.4
MQACNTTPTQLFNRQSSCKVARRVLPQTAARVLKVGARKQAAFGRVDCSIDAETPRRFRSSRINLSRVHSLTHTERLRNAEGQQSCRFGTRSTYFEDCCGNHRSRNASWRLQRELRHETFAETAACGVFATIQPVIEQALVDLQGKFAEVDARTARHIRRNQKAFCNARISPYHWTGSSGYGRGDPGREALEECGMRAGVFVSGGFDYQAGRYGPQGVWHGCSNRCNIGGVSTSRNGATSCCVAGLRRALPSRGGLRAHAISIRNAHHRLRPFRCVALAEGSPLECKALDVTT